MRVLVLAAALALLPQLAQAQVAEPTVEECEWVVRGATELEFVLDEKVDLLKTQGKLAEPALDGVVALNCRRDSYLPALGDERVARDLGLMFAIGGPDGGTLFLQPAGGKLDLVPPEGSTLTPQDLEAIRKRVEALQARLPAG